MGHSDDKNDDDNDDLICLLFQHIITDLNLCLDKGCVASETLT